MVSNNVIVHRDCKDSNQSKNGHLLLKDQGGIAYPLQLYVQI